MSKTVWEEQLNIVNQFVIYLSQIALRRGDFAAGPCCRKKSGTFSMRRELKATVTTDITQNAAGRHFNKRFSSVVSR
jgi:hypothetical protein